jgi:ribosomal protein S18 acetylase RimI-like enzyme
MYNQGYFNTTTKMTYQIIRLSRTEFSKAVLTEVAKISPRSAGLLFSGDRASDVSLAYKAVDSSGHLVGLASLGKELGIYGIVGIWTNPFYRRRGIAGLLLTEACKDTTSTLNVSVLSESLLHSIERLPEEVKLKLVVTNWIVPHFQFILD